MYPLRVFHILFNTVERLPPLLHELESVHEERIAIDVFQLPERETPRIREGNASVTFHRARLRFRSLLRSQRLLSKLIRFIEWAVAVFLAVLRTPTHVIVAHDLPSLLPAWAAGRLRRRPIVYHAHELWGESNGLTAPFPTLWRMLDRFLCPRVDAIVVPEKNRAGIYRNEYGASGDPLVIPNYPPYRQPVSSTFLSDFVKSKGASAEIIVLYQGLFDPSRELENLVSAMVHVEPRACLILMGSGTPAFVRTLEQRIRETSLADRVFLHPAVPYDRLHAYTCSADIGVLLYRNNCRNNYYCAPNKLYEYLQAGLAVVASDFPGLVDIVEGHELGRTVDGGDPASIGRAIQELLDGQVRRAIRTRSLALAESEFRWECVAGGLFDLYHRLITGRWNDKRGGSSCR
ncbi:MAG: glycosyltransferase [Bacteroidota bacterium]|nr:glycosyltransferase [Bacteroidota bacterium]